MLHYNFMGSKVLVRFLSFTPWGMVTFVSCEKLGCMPKSFSVAIGNQFGIHPTNTSPHHSFVPGDPEGAAGTCLELPADHHALSGRFCAVELEGNSYR